MRIFKGSDKLIYSQAVGTAVILVAALIANNTQYLGDITGPGLMWSLAGVLASIMLANWLMDNRVHGLMFDDEAIEIRYRRRRITLSRQQITRIESVGSIQAPAWFVYTDEQRYLVQTEKFPRWIRLQILDQMQKFRRDLR
ncbi:hypothetical protein [Gallaecimonas pentaromativorans]|uniref:Uncharacterized protein n=1 Tax=Gallaecimonas pentaromativorans TaxID=584787 RepID=A0A3N1PUB0_9GAMM|nr:hypothetical protein [Gallaecimonas pentaromativorans]MED5526304.1 hypothetical protein [Pseudomonadota bacterium]ROQ30340.1 hypothetical protein EDC28_10126 [Gallaecimonas pentaromativorans]